MNWDLCLSLFVFSIIYGIIDGSHYRGGIISWRPVNIVPSGTSAQILIYQRYFWNRQWGSFSAPYCTEATVAAQTTIPVGGSMSCLQNCGSSTYSSLPIAMSTTDCDANPIIQSWSGERYDTVTLPLTTSITMGFTGNAWLAALYIGGGGAAFWSLVNRLNLATRPDGYLNTSPVTTTLPVILYPVNTSIVHIVQMADNDGTDTLRCRWSDANSTYNINRYDECAGVCRGLPVGTLLFGDNCTLRFTLPSVNLYYACALQIEDYFDSTTTTAMSSVPIQFLFYAYKASLGACSQAPTIIGVRPNRACIGVPINVTFTEIVRIQTYCIDQAIVDLVTTSPVGMTHSPIAHPSTYIWEMTLTWTPKQIQSGPQGFCAGAIDNSTLQSAPWCITYLVDYTSPNLVRPQVVQGSASPIGTVFSNQSRFAITATDLVGRPTRNFTNICFNNYATNVSVICYDAGYAPNIVYTGYTVVITTNISWTPGQSYYVTMDSGFASGNVFCHAESTPIYDTTFWRFDIWNPAVSSTTTTTTTPPTTHTVTTLGLSTSTINTLLTTTGIAATNATVVTTLSTASTTVVSTTTVTTTAVITVSGLTTESTVAVMYPKDFEDACKQPVAIMTAVCMFVMMPVQALAMYATFTKISNIFNPSKINARIRHKQRMTNILRR